MPFDAGAYMDEVSFSRTAAGWVTTPQLEALERGELSAAELLADECERRGEDPPTVGEINSFTADLEDQQRALRATIGAFDERVGNMAEASLASMSDLAKRLSVPVPSTIPKLASRPMTSMVEQQQLAVAVLNKLATEAERASRRAERSDKRSTVILVATAMIALATLLAGIFGVHL